MKIFESNDKDVFIKKIRKNRYLIQIPYNKTTKLGQKRKIFWDNFPWLNLKIVEKRSSKEEIRDIIIQSEVVQTLPDFLAGKNHNIGYQLGLQLFTDIGNQLKTLEQFNIYLSPLDLKDIVVIGEHFFIMNDSKNVVFFSDTIDIETNKLKIIHKWQKNKFVGPEIKQIKSLPASISIRSSYYNIGALVVYALFKKYIDTENLKNVESILENIKETKLYWALKRCLEPEAKKRYILII